MKLRLALFPLLLVSHLYVWGQNTWQALPNAPNFSGDFSKLDEAHLFASIAGTNLEGGAKILVSTDGGDSWTSKQVPIEGTQLQGVGFLTPQQGFAGGFFPGIYSDNSPHGEPAARNVPAGILHKRRRYHEKNREGTCGMSSKLKAMIISEL